MLIKILWIVIRYKIDNSDIVYALIEGGANINAQDNSQQTSLMLGKFKMFIKIKIN